jgi:hypothetical protein
MEQLLDDVFIWPKLWRWISWPTPFRERATPATRREDSYGIPEPVIRRVFCSSAGSMVLQKQDWTIAYAKVLIFWSDVYR